MLKWLVYTPPFFSLSLFLFLIGLVAFAENSRNPL